MSDEIIFLTIWKDEEKTVVIEYKPRREGRIEIVSVDITFKPVSPWKQRQADRRKHGGLKRRGIVLSDEEEQAEAMLPTTQLERQAERRENSNPSRP